MTTRKTRAAVATSTPSLLTAAGGSNVDDLRSHLHSPVQFADILNQCLQLVNLHSSLVDVLCSILAESTTSGSVDSKVIVIILDSLVTNHETLLVELSDIQFKQDLLPFIKRILTISNDDNSSIFMSLLQLLITLVEQRFALLALSLSEWLSSVLTFVVTRISASTYIDYGDLVIDLLSKIVTRFTPLSKEIVDVLGRSPSSIVSTNFLAQLKTWVKHIDDTRLALFAIHLWSPLAALLSRLLSRGHTKGNEMLAIIQDAFVAANYSVRGAAFSAWASFMSHVYRLDTGSNGNMDDIHQQQLHNRLLKLFLTPFLPDYTSKSKSASIAKCRAWLVLVPAYPTHIDDVLLPFLSFAFGYHTTYKIGCLPIWWSECRRIGAQYLHDLLVENTHISEQVIKLAGDQILTYLFDIIFDELQESTISFDNNNKDNSKSFWLSIWHAYLIHLTRLLTSNMNSIVENQRVTINTCLLTRIEQLWIDSRMPTRYLLRLFDTFEQTGFPLAIETVLRDSSIRTKTLSATQNHPISGSQRSQEKLSPSDSSSSYRTTLSDQYLHMMLEHAVRFNDDDGSDIEDAYLHVLSYLIDTLSKTSDDNFCLQTCSLLLKCSVELSLQPLTIPSLSWHIWSRCSQHLILILNRARSFTNHVFDIADNQRQETSVELLLRPFAFGDAHRLDHTSAILWTQLFKALCRLALLDGGQSTDLLVTLLVQILRHGPAFEQAAIDQHYQRLFGFLLVTLKTLLKTLSEIDSIGTSDRPAISTSSNHFTGFFLSQKRSSPASSFTLCLTQLSILINCVLQRILSNNENTTQWTLVCYCLLKSNKTSSIDQSKSIVFTYVRDLVVDLFNTCKTCAQLEIVLSNTTHIVSFLLAHEQATIANTTVGLSPISASKQQDNVILGKVLSIMHAVFEPSNASSLLQLIYPLLTLAFQHGKTAIRNKARKFWNETFGRLTFLIYPNELRACLRDLKDKEHLLLPCFLADQDNSNTIGSGPPPSSTDESQLSQQVDIATPLITPIYQQRSTPVIESLSSPVRFLSPALPSSRSTTIGTIVDTREPMFVPIKTNINHNNRPDSPVVIGKRTSNIGSSGGLTEKQKEKLRTRQAIPLLCDDSSHTQSNSQSFLLTTDTPTIESLMATYQLRSNGSNSKLSTNGTKKRPTAGLSLFKQPVSNSTTPEQSAASAQETSETEQPPSTTTDPTDAEATPPSNDNHSATTESDVNPTVDRDEESTHSHSQSETNEVDEEMTEESSSIAKKLRRSRRPSTSARKSFANGKRKKPIAALPAEVAASAISAIVPTIVIDPPSSSESPTETTTVPVKGPPKSILKRLSPTRPRTDHTRHVAFHDQVKVLLFASPVRRETTQQKKKSPIKEDGSSGRIIPRENLPLRQQPMSTRRLSAMNIDPPVVTSVPPTNNSKTRSSKLFHPKDALADWSHEISMNSNNDLSELPLDSSLAEEQVTNESPPIDAIFPPLIDCDKPLDSLIHVLFGGLSPTNALNYFRTIKINTVGDLARSTAAQIEIFPIPSPKSENMRKALSYYNDRLFNSPSLSPIVAINGDSLTPIASTSDEPIAISDGTFTKESSSLPPAIVSNSDPHDSLYDIDTMIDSLDYERLYLNDNENDKKEIDEESPPSLPPASTSSVDFIRTRRQAALNKRPEQSSPQKRRLSPANEDDEHHQQLHDDDNDHHQISPKKPSIQIPRQITLGERLQKAADNFANNGTLHFDDDYIELIRHLLNNPSLTHLEQLHLKTIFFDQE